MSPHIPPKEYQPIWSLFFPLYASLSSWMIRGNRIKKVPLCCWNHSWCRRKRVWSYEWEFWEILEFVKVSENALWGQGFNIKALITIFSIFINTNMFPFPMNNFSFMWVAIAFLLDHYHRVLCYLGSCTFVSYSLHSFVGTLDRKRI